jgi:hypothetical protein
MRGGTPKREKRRKEKTRSSITMCLSLSIQFDLYCRLPLRLCAFQLWYGLSLLKVGSGWVMIFAAALSLRWCAWFWFIPAANQIGFVVLHFECTGKMPRVSRVADGTLFFLGTWGIIYWLIDWLTGAGPSWTMPLMCLPCQGCTGLGWRLDIGPGGGYTLSLVAHLEFNSQRPWVMSGSDVDRCGFIADG